MTNYKISQRFISDGLEKTIPIESSGDITYKRLYFPATASTTTLSMHDSNTGAVYNLNKPTWNMRILRMRIVCTGSGQITIAPGNTINVQGTILFTHSNISTVGNTYDINLDIKYSKNYLTITTSSATFDSIEIWGIEYLT